MLPVKVKRLTSTAKIPTRATDDAAGYDLYADADAVVHRGEFVRVKCGIALQMPTPPLTGPRFRYEAQIRPRSGMASRGIVAQFGTIDSDFRGEVCVTLANLGQIYGYMVRRGDRIGQMVFSKVEIPELEPAAVLEETVRGDKGWGSSGT